MTPSRYLAVLVLVGGLTLIGYSQYSGAHRPPAATGGSAHHHPGGHEDHSGQEQVVVRQDEALLRARAAAQTYFGLLAGGDWAGAWDWWSAKAQRTVPRKTFAEVGTVCRTDLGVPFIVTSTRPAGTGIVAVTWTRLGAQGIDRMIREKGAWRFDPPAKTLARYASGPKKAACR